MLRTLIAAAAMLAAVPAQAEDWWVASTDHFNIYSTGGEDSAKELAIDMERLDAALRFMRGVAMDNAPMTDAQKLSVFQFGDTRDIGRLVDSTSVAGFFISRAGGSVAFVPLREPRRRGSYGARKGGESIPPNEVLFHEYTHYFMYQHSPAAYPRWYSEGFAELFGTVDLIDDGFRIGRAPESRSSMLYWYSQPIEKMLDPIDYEDMTGLDAYQDYSYGWLLTSYLSIEPSRAGQLAQYLTAMNRGEEPIEAAKAAFGDLDQLEKELDSYRRGRARITEVKLANFEMPEATVRQLDAGAAAAMDIHMLSSVGVDEDEAASLVPKARSLVASYPQNMAVLRMAMEAEFDAENYDEATGLARRMLAIDADSADAHIYLARVAEERAEDDPAQYATMRSEYIAANRINPDDPRALSGYYHSFVLAGEAPPEDAIIALERAYSLAKFDDRIRQSLAWQLLTENRDKEAIAVLGPIVYNPHGGDTVERLSERVEEIEAGNKTKALEELHPGWEDPEEDED
jgi:hypothetical protein